MSLFLFVICPSVMAGYKKGTAAGLGTLMEGNVWESMRIEMNPARNLYECRGKDECDD